jgi:RNA polymerase sigma-70 factor (ECF subfamily)
VFVRRKGVSGSYALTAIRAAEVEAPERGARGGGALEDRSVEALVAAHQRGLIQFLLRYVGDEDTARDLAQQAFIQALTHLDRFRQESALRTWLFRIARNLATDHLRTRHRDEPLEDQDAADPNARSWVGGDVPRLRAAVGRLPRRQREVVELRAYEEMEFPEIARVLDTTALAARVNYHFALKRLRKELGVP